MYEGWLRAETFVGCHENVITFKFDDSLLELPAIRRSFFAIVEVINRSKEI